MNKKCTIEIILTDKELAKDDEKKFKSFVIEVDSTDESQLYENINKWLQNPAHLNDKNDIISYISDKLSITGKIKIPSINELKNTEHLQGNTTINYISSMYGIPSPEITNPGRFEVLLIDGLFKRNGVHVSNRRILNSNGKELFILNGNKKSDIYQFFNYLKTREKIEQFEFEDDQDFKTLVSAYNKFNKNKKNSKKIDENTSKDEQKILIKEMLLDFLNNKTSYAGSKVEIKVNDKSIKIFDLLDLTTRNIFELPYRVRYNNDFIDHVNIRLIYSKLLSKDKMLISIGLESIFEGLNSYFKEVIDLFETNKRSIKYLFGSDFKQKLHDSIKNYIKKQPGNEELADKQLSNKEILKYIPNLFQNEVIGDIILQLLNSDNPTFIDLLNGIFKTNKEFPLNCNEYRDGSLYFKWANYTLYEKYGITYDTIELMSNPESYLGYNIYNQTVNNDDGTTSQYFYISRGYLDPKLKEKRYSSLDEAKSEIDNKIQNQNISTNSLIEFNFRDPGEDYNKRSIVTRTALTPKTIINVLDIPVKKVNNSEITDNEIKIIFGDSKMSDFLNLVSTWNISEELKQYITEEINTPEKVVIFIYKLNEKLKQDRSNNDVINSIVSLIKNNSSKTRSYYIEKSVEVKNGFVHYIIPTEATQVIKSNKKSQPYNVPIQTYLQVIKQQFDKMFDNKVEVKLLTSSEIKQQKLLSPEDINTTKAFIKNGVIYINTTNASSNDLVHEYLHLILGTLKVNNELRQNYENLIYSYISSNKSKFDTFKEYNSYKGLSEIDLMEEFFIRNFSNWLMDQRGNRADSEIFKQIEQITEYGINSSNIFSESVDITKGFFNEKITIFHKLSHDIAKQLENNETVWAFGDTLTTRKYSNWINKQIQDGQIKEKCN